LVRVSALVNVWVKIIVSVNVMLVLVLLLGPRLGLDLLSLLRVRSSTNVRFMV
jgi:hypothetical protein